MTADNTGGKKKKTSKMRRQEAVAGWIFVMPAVLFWLIWFLYPALKAISISFFQYNYATPETNTFIGLANYVRLFQDPKFFTAMGHSFLMVAIVVPLQTILSFAIAVLLNGPIRLKGFYRSSCYIPYVISAMAVTIFFMYFFVKGGPASSFFALLGMENVSWFASTKYAMAFLMIVYVWQQVGFYMVIFIGALQEVPMELYEAAKVDGANAWQRFKCIIIPSIRTIVVLNLILSVSGALSAFEMPYVVTGGTFGTSTYFVVMNKMAHTDMKVGLASAMAVVLLALILVVTLVQKFAEIMMDRAENKPHNYGKKVAAK